MGGGFCAAVGERWGGPARDTHHVREFHLRGVADVRLREEKGGSGGDGQSGASRGTDTFLTGVASLFSANAARGWARMPTGPRARLREGPRGAHGGFVGGCTHMIDPRHDLRDLSLESRLWRRALVCDSKELEVQSDGDAFCHVEPHHWPVEIRSDPPSPQRLRSVERRIEELRQ